MKTVPSGTSGRTYSWHRNRRCRRNVRRQLRTTCLGSSGRSQMARVRGVVRSVSLRVLPCGSKKRFRGLHAPRNGASPGLGTKLVAFRRRGHLAGMMEGSAEGIGRGGSTEYTNSRPKGAMNRGGCDEQGGKTFVKHCGHHWKSPLSSPSGLMFLSFYSYQYPGHCRPQKAVRRRSEVVQHLLNSPAVNCHPGMLVIKRPSIRRPGSGVPPQAGAAGVFVLWCCEKGFRCRAIFELGLAGAIHQGTFVGSFLADQPARVWAR